MYQNYPNDKFDFRISARQTVHSFVRLTVKLEGIKTLNILKKICASVSWHFEKVGITKGRNWTIVT